ncbi:hypothetical protein [Labrys miyagiensis]|uniref:hypothetical protein n=1 Tax=Labrys miyagiensis TaxID=346912 RepID=UPI0024E14EF8|nr:hypothetical protein [Labrys miyagiensis]
MTAKRDKEHSGHQRQTGGRPLPGEIAGGMTAMRQGIHFKFLLNGFERRSTFDDLLKCQRELRCLIDLVLHRCKPDR